jgi:transcriptional repressor NrdR
MQKSTTIVLHLITACAMPALALAIEGPESRERLEEVVLMVVKRSGDRTPFNRSKIIAGVSAASKGRPVEEEQIEVLADKVEEALRATGNEVTSAQVGHEVLEQLRELDEVAYLRFASVYKNFDQAADFRRELALLKK